MKRSLLLFALVGVLAGRIAHAQQICAGAEGASQVCAAACSNTVVNENDSNQGKFNSGSNNIGDGNDGFNNQGSFNIGSGNKANCALGSGLTGGSCDPSNNNGQMVLRFCRVLPADGKCQPSGYLPEFTQALQTQIAAVVASCNGGPALPTPPPPAPGSPAAPPTSASPPTPTPPTPQPTVLPPGAANYEPVSDSKADLVTLLYLFQEHIKQEKALGRKMK